MLVDDESQAELELLQIYHSIQLNLVFVLLLEFTTNMNSMKLVISLHSLYWSIHTKDESKRGSAFAFIFGVN